LSPAFSNAARATLLALAIVGATSRAHAEEKTNSAPTAVAPSEDAIAIAKREFEAVKSARDAGMQPKGGLPSLAVPELQAPASGTTWMPPKTIAPPKKSTHWLVDAMEKKSDARKDSRREQTDREHELRTDATESDLTESLADDKSAAGRKGAASPDSERKSKPSVVNPLTQYLGDWMRPQDYALLKPGLEQSLAGAGSTTRDGNFGYSALNTNSGTLTANVEATLGLGASNAVAPALATAPHENPYLQLLNPSAASAPTAASPLMNIAPAPAPSSPSTMSASLALPAPPPPPKSRMPEFVKPATDEKYFKPLKRF
jgi:hypothetical protein